MKAFCVVGRVIIVCPEHGELLYSHFDQIPATLTGITHDVIAGSASGGFYGARNS